MSRTGWRSPIISCLIGARFEDAANALLTADRQLYQSNHAEAIRQIFVARGFLPNPKRKLRRAGQRFDQ